MRRRRLVWIFYLWFLATALVAALGGVAFAVRSARHRWLAHAEERLLRDAGLLSRAFADRFHALPANALQSLVNDISTQSSLHISLLDIRGEVVADSLQDPGTIWNQADKSEVADALSGQIGQSIRTHEGTGQSMLFVAVPIPAANGDPISALRVALPMKAALRGWLSFAVAAFLFALALSAAAALLSLRVAGRLATDLQFMSADIRRIAHENMSLRVPLPSQCIEIDHVAAAVNELADWMEHKIDSLIGQRNEADAVLSSMTEGVVAVNVEEELILLNLAAARMLGVNSAESLGRNILEVVRNTDLQQFVRRTLESDDAVEGDFGLHGQGESHIQAHGTVLRNAQRRRIGALVVLHDITRLRRLENIRRDFVANVSHELKTPITSIKGFVETLLDGAVDSPDDARRFLDIVNRHANRLNSIIDDLLSLSRIEQESSRGEMEIERVRVADVIAAAVQLCQTKAQEKRIVIRTACPERACASLNARLIEQSLVNLIDNAIKFSAPGGRIEVRASEADGALSLDVQDWGCGIDPQHLPRLFERFYRVDKARSRELGGTGLGLAIVKHIAQAHGGTVTVSSRPGSGSTFTLRLPGRPKN